MRKIRSTFEVESRAGIIPRPSLLNLGVQLSLHPASDVLTFAFAHVYVIVAAFVDC